MWIRRKLHICRLELKFIYIYCSDSDFKSTKLQNITRRVNLNPYSILHIQLLIFYVYANSWIEKLPSLPLSVFDVKCWSSFWTIIVWIFVKCSNKRAEYIEKYWHILFPQFDLLFSLSENKYFTKFVNRTWKEKIGKIHRNWRNWISLAVCGCSAAAHFDTCAHLLVGFFAPAIVTLFNTLLPSY